jgi:hypothetical protein
MKVTIIGAGPVGLAASILLAQRGEQVTVIEKRSENTRTQFVRLKPNRLKFLPNLTPLMRLYDLQNSYKEIALSLGVTFRTGEVFNLDRHSGKVILATGSKCSIRDEIFGPPIHLSEPKLVVVCRYQSKNSPRVLSQISEWYPTLKILEGVATEQIKGNSVSLFWEPSSEEGILNRLRFWLNMRGDQIVPGTLLYSNYRSTLYQSQTFAKQIDNKTVYVIGDCAVGVPYFKSLQNGLENLPLIFLDPNQYNIAMENRVFPTTSSALVQTNSYDLASLYLQISRWVPWQINAWSEEYVHEMMTKDVPGL